MGLQELLFIRLGLVTSHYILWQLNLLINDISLASCPLECSDNLLFSYL